MAPTTRLNRFVSVPSVRGLWSPIIPLVFTVSILRLPVGPESKVAILYFTVRRSPTVTRFSLLTLTILMWSAVATRRTNSGPKIATLLYNSGLVDLTLTPLGSGTIYR